MRPASAGHEEGAVATGKDRGSREARERARVYQARQELHAGQSRRRRRDNLVGALAGGVLVLAAIGAQTAYFSVGPGAPEPSPSPSTPDTPSAPATPSPSATPTPTDSPAGPTPTP
jgi:hypothetical protein